MSEVERVRPSLPDRYRAPTGRVQLTGIQALARLPIDQHRIDRAHGRNVGTLISGYEGSPIAGYDLELGRISRILEANDVTFVPGLNEESAATALQGTQLAPGLGGATRDGVLGLWYGKAPGLDRATDAIRHGNLMGSHPQGGAVLFVGDDPAAKSSSVPCASDFALQDLVVPFLCPGDSAEVLEYGLHAIALSRASGLWTALKIVTAVADGSSTVDLGTQGLSPLLPPGSGRHVPTARLLQPTLGPLERDQITTRLRIAREYSRLNTLNQVLARGEADRVGIVAGGRTWRDTLAALQRLGYDAEQLPTSPIRLLKIGMPYPLDPGTVVEFADGLDQVIVIEEKRSFLESAIRDVLYRSADAPLVAGKHDTSDAELFPAYGELDGDLIAARLHRALSAADIACGPHPNRHPAAASRRRRLPLAQRAPYFCSGCPHNSSTKPLEGALVGAGIGCHAMVLLMDQSQVGEVTGLSQMGGEGLQWIGMAPFVERSHYVQNLGDGTFDHSGSLAIRAAVSAGINITYKLLYNSAVAMTGGQRTVSAMSVPRIVDLLLAEGVAGVLVTTEDPSRYRRVRLPKGVQVWDRSRLDEAQRTLASIAGVTVLIHDQECATEKRRRRRRGKEADPQTRVFINERVCEGCGDCGRTSNCLSVHPVPTPFGRKTRIHQASCNTDLSCLDGDCPAFMSVRVSGRSAPTGRTAAAWIDGQDLPTPEVLVAAEDFGVRLTGIGGTGVVTVSQVLATAGLLCGLTARSLDQTGLAQKGGAVVSDVRFSRGPGSTSKLGRGECDLYLGCDLLVAADPANLRATAPDRTITVLSTTEVPTGAMVSDPTAVFPRSGQVVAQVVEHSRRAHVLDARAMAQGLFGDDQYANIFMVGIGFQAGALPLPAEAIEQAIELNGVAVETNVQAFRRGRQYVVDPDTVTRAATGAARNAIDAIAEAEDLDTLVDGFTAELTAYQDPRYGARYRAQVEEVRRAEAALGSGSPGAPETTALTEAVARNLFKLMAYKDEYEVARLCLRPELRTELTETFGPGARASWRLHPPALRALGLERKLTLGPRFRPALRALYALRRLRGSAFDPFGRAAVRRVERTILAEYVDVVDLLHSGLTAENRELAVQIAGLPDLVRGYEEIKLASVERYRTRLAELAAAYQGT